MRINLFGTKIYTIQIGHYFCEVRKGKIFYRGYIRDDHHNIIWWTPFGETDEQVLFTMSDYLADRSLA